MANEFLERFSFVHLTIFYINVLQHFYWRDGVVLETWKMIDRELSNLMKQDINIVIISDHGSNKIDHVFNINTWLRQKGYLKLNYTVSDILSRLGLTKRKARKFLESINLESKISLRDKIPNGIIERIPDETTGLTRSAKADKIDWERSKAVAGGQGPIYLLENNMESRNRLMGELEAVEHPTTGQSPVEDAYTFEQVYTGQGNYSPDIIVDQSKGWHIAGGIGHAKVFSESHSWKAENKRNGIFVFYGEEFQTDKKISEIEILDIAPTLCHMYDLPIPEEMDGQVCSAVFSEESTAATREPQWESIKTEYMNRRAEFNNDAKDRLTDLGYL